MWTRAISILVMAGHVPAIHVFVSAKKSKTWMPGTRQGMTGDDGANELSSGFFAPQQRFPAIPANGQWPFARLVCNAAGQHPEPREWRVFRAFCKKSTGRTHAQNGLA